MMARKQVSCSIKQKELSNILAAMQPICTKKSPLDITSSILFYFTNTELVLKSTDLEISLQTSCPYLESTIDHEISFLITGKRIFDLVRELEETVHLTLEENKIIVESETTKASLSIQPADMFPSFPEKIENLLSCNSEQMLKMLEQSLFMIPQNASNTALNGLFFEVSETGCTMTATDGHCLNHLQNPEWKTQNSTSWLIPRRSIVELKKVIDTMVKTQSSLFIGVCSGQLVFSGETFNFFTKLLADSYPQFKNILAYDGFVKGVINRSALVKALRRVNSLLLQQFIATKCVFEKEFNQLVLVFKNKEVGELRETITLDEYDGDELTMFLYAPYLLNGIQNIDQSTITFYVKAPIRPLVCTYAITEHIKGTYIIMPVSSQQQS